MTKRRALADLMPVDSWVFIVYVAAASHRLNITTDNSPIHRKRLATSRAAWYDELGEIQFGLGAIWRSPVGAIKEKWKCKQT